jgi:hypothetical protein
MILEVLDLSELVRLRLVNKAAYNLQIFSDTWRELIVDEKVNSFINSSQSLINFINQRPKSDFISIDLSRVNLLAKDKELLVKAVSGIQLTKFKDS